jgi:hypothetical protein
MTAENTTYLESLKEWEKQLELSIKENDLNIHYHTAYVDIHQNGLQSEKRQRDLNVEQLTRARQTIKQLKNEVETVSPAY